MYVVIYCSFIFSLCIFIFYFSSEILAKFSYSVNPRLNKVYVCMYVESSPSCVIAKISMTSPIVINMPTRELLAGETKNSFV